MDELIRRAMAETDDEDDEPSISDQATEDDDTAESGSGKNPADEDIFVLDGDSNDGTDQSSGDSEKDQLRKMLAEGAKDDGDTSTADDGLTEVTDSSEEQSIPRKKTSGAVSKDDQRRIPGDQQQEAIPESKGLGAGATAEAVSRSEGQQRQASVGQQNEAMATPGGPVDDDESRTGEDDTDEHEAQAESSEASAERLSELSSPGSKDSQQTESPKERFRKLKEEARQEFIQKERDDNEATVEKETDSLKEKYDKLADDHIVH